MQLTGAEIVIECLKEQGVDTVFGYPGGTILNIYDALYKHKEIQHILTSHEQGAAHAADGYARATGKVGVCMATSGPGATNLVTGIATAYMDSVPMVAITAMWFCPCWERIHSRRWILQALPCRLPNMDILSRIFPFLRIPSVRLSGLHVQAGLARYWWILQKM